MFNFSRSAGRLRRRALVLDPLDLSADGAQLLFDLLVTAVDVVDAIQPRRTTGDEAGEDECRRGAEVGAHHARALQFLHALDNRRRAFLADAGAHAVELADVQE